MNRMVSLSVFLFCLALIPNIISAHDHGPGNPDQSSPHLTPSYQHPDKDYCQFVENFNQSTLINWHAWNSGTDHALNAGEWSSELNYLRYEYTGSDPDHTRGNYLSTNNTPLNMNEDWILESRIGFFTSNVQIKVGFALVPDETVVVDHDAGTWDPPTAQPPIEMAAFSIYEDEISVFNNSASCNIWDTNSITFQLEKRGYNYTFDVNGLGNITSCRNITGNQRISLFVETTGGSSKTNLIFTHVKINARADPTIKQMWISDGQPTEGHNITIKTLVSNAETHTSAEWPILDTKITFLHTIDRDLDGLVAWYDFDDGEGNVLHDRSDNGHDGDILGPTWSEGFIGGGLKFDGANDYIDLGNDEDLALTGDYTFQAWVKLPSKGFYYALMDRYEKDGDKYYGYTFYITEGHFRASHYDAGRSCECMIMEDVWDDGWQMVTATLIDGLSSLYLGPNLHMTTVNSYSVSHSDRSTTLGQRSNGWGGYMPFDGVMDEVRIYDRALTADEVRNSYYTDLLAMDKSLEVLGSQNVTIVGDQDKIVTTDLMVPAGDRSIIAILESMSHLDRRPTDNYQLLNLLVLPDLNVSFTEISSDFPLENEEMTINLTVCNNGHASCEASVSLWEGDPTRSGELITDVKTISTTPGGVYDVSFQWMVPKGAMDHDIYAYVVSNGMADLNLVDNVAYKLLHVNDRPMVLTIPNIEILEDSSVTGYDLDGWFYDSHELTYTYSGQNIVTITHDDDNKITITGLENMNGFDVIQITATDPYGAHVSANLNITVISVNDAPVFEGLEDLHFPDPLTKTKVHTIDLENHITDVDHSMEEISVSITSELATLDGNVATIEVPYGNTETMHTFQASDGKYTTSHDMRMIITWVDLPPTLAPFNPAYVTKDIESFYDIEPYVQDREDDTLQISCGSEYVIVSGYELRINVTDHIEQVNVSVTVTDSSHNAVKGVLIIYVNLPNRPPTISGNDITVNEGEEVALTVDIYDPDMDITSVTYSGAMTTNRWLTDHDDAGVYYVTITVSDGEHSAWTQIRITVVDVNRLPDAAIDYEVISGGKVHFQAANSSDEDGDHLTYHWDFGDGEFSYVKNPEHEYSSSGTYRVILMVSDGKGNATKTTDVVVTVSSGRVIPSYISAFLYFLLFLSIAIAATIVLIFCLSELGIWIILTMVIIPLYSRLTKDKILDNDIRKRILQFVHNNPGAHYLEIRRHLQLANGTSAYHLNVLQKEGFLWSENEGLTKRFYPTGLKKFKPKKHSKSQKQILHILSEHRDLTQKEIVMLSDLPQSTVSRNLKTLEGENAVVSTLLKHNGDKPKITYNIFDRKDDFKNCPYCGKEFQVKKRPKFCPFCSEKLD